MKQTILNIARGVEHWTVLRHRLGIWRNGNKWFPGSYQDPIEITVDDLLLGFENYLANDVELQEWASLILGASNIFAFDTDTDPRFDDLVGMLWDATFGEEVDAKRIKALMST